MSEVVSFRLDPENPREAQALNVLKRWQGKGYRTRDILTRSLLKLDVISSIDAEMEGLVSQLHVLNQKIDQLKLQDAGSKPEASALGELPEKFRASLRNSVKPGIKAPS